MHCIVSPKHRLIMLRIWFQYIYQAVKIAEQFFLNFSGLQRPNSQISLFFFNLSCLALSIAVSFLSFLVLFSLPPSSCLCQSSGRFKKKKFVPRFLPSIDQRGLACELGAGIMMNTLIMQNQSVCHVYGHRGDGIYQSLSCSARIIRYATSRFFFFFFFKEEW